VVDIEDNMDTIEAARYTAWKSTINRASWTYEDFCKATHDWVVHPVKGGAVLARKSELHACIFPNSMSRKVLKILNETLKEHGEVVTSTSVGNLIGESFVSKLGFKRTHVINNVQYWRLTNGT
jgi:hypothetical protein